MKVLNCVSDKSKYWIDFVSKTDTNIFFEVCLLAGSVIDDVIFPNSSIAIFKFSVSNNILITTMILFWSLYYPLHLYDYWCLQTGGMCCHHHSNETHDLLGSPRLLKRIGSLMSFSDGFIHLGSLVFHLGSGISFPFLLCIQLRVSKIEYPSQFAAWLNFTFTWANCAPSCHTKFCCIERLQLILITPYFFIIIFRNKFLMSIL